jgi:dihydroorotate dehydrogenase electron transfer subunit
MTTFLLPKTDDFDIYSGEPGNDMTKDPKARIVAVERWDDYRLFRIETPLLARQARPGQFLMIKVSDGTSPLLRRPICVHFAEEDCLEIFFQIAGRGTEILARKSAGEMLDVLGPLGRGFTLDDARANRRVLCVGGGRGIAPMYFLALELKRFGADPMVLYGGRSIADLPLRDKFERAGIALRCSTDDGSFGFKGFVTGLAKEEIAARRPDFLCACGPDAMMKSASLLALEYDIPAEFSLEALMGCGIGVCWGCVKRIRREGGEGWVKICEEGPVFPLERIVWTGDK